jgi:diguanylate cyclase (GGDEF)-like protein
MVNFQQVQGLPFIIGASITKDAYLSEWTKSVRLIFIITLIVLVVIIIMFQILIRSYRNNRSFQFQAEHDPLTGLLNRKLFHDRLDQAILKASRERKILAILFVDIDRFKHINDQFGHQIGDLTLKEIAVRLHSCVRDYDSIARLGGDEFVILLENIENKNNAYKVAINILNKLHQKMHFNSTSISIAASVGISMFPEDSVDETLLIEAADKAMYEIKQLGGNAIQFFHHIK